MPTPRLLRYGAAYYPELWPDSIAGDVAMMKKCGIDAVRIGEFAWSTMEPAPGKFDFSLLLKAMDTLHKAGIGVVLGTPTATPPSWLTAIHPDCLIVKTDGRQMHPGSRQHVCINNPSFRERVAVIVERMAEALGRHPALVAWQIDNELKAHVLECACESCLRLWAEWLERRHGSVANLNKAWHTAVWSQTFNSFSQVPSPLPTTAMHNPSMLTAFRRFHQESAADFQALQIAKMRPYSSAPATHNGNIHHHVHNLLQFKNTDFASVDFYHDCEHWEGVVFDYDLWRNIKGGPPFWVMETSPGNSGCCLGYRRIHRRGFLKSEAVAAFASGAGAFCYWLWRGQPGGAEMPHGSIVSAWGKPATGWADVVEAGRAKDELKDMILSSSPCVAELAINYSDDARSMMLSEPLEGPDYLALMGETHKLALDSGMHRDLILDDASLEGRRIVWTPFMPHIPDRLSDRLRRFTEEGGTWIIGPMSGYRTAEHTANLDACLGGRLEDFAGVETVENFSPTHSEERGRAFGVETELSQWSFFFRTATDVETLGTVCQGRAEGRAFITSRRRGKGRVLMLGSMPAGKDGRAMMLKLLARCSKDAGVRLKSACTEGVVAIPRKGMDGRLLWFMVDMGGKGGSCKLKPSRLRDAFNGKPLKNPVEVPPYGFRVVRVQAD